MKGGGENWTQTQAISHSHSTRPLPYTEAKVEHLALFILVKTTTTKPPAVVTLNRNWCRRSNYHLQAQLYTLRSLSRV